MAKAEAKDKKIQVVYLHEVIQNPGLQGTKTLSTKNIPGLEFEYIGDGVVEYTLQGKPGGLIPNIKSAVYEK